MTIKDETNADRRKIAKMTGTIRAYEFILKVEQDQRRRLMRRIFKLCKENAELGGSEYKRVLKDYTAKAEPSRACLNGERVWLGLVYKQAKE